jgi:hypothetical protein
MTATIRTFLTLFACAALILLSRPAGAQTGPVGVGAGVDLSVIRQAIFGGLRNGVGTIPTPTGGAFTYEFDPTTGIFSRTTDTLGPIFADRSQTVGKGKFTLSTNLTYHSYDELDDSSLKSGELQAITSFSNDFATRLSLLSIREQITAEVYTLGATYGVTERIDVGLTLPIVRVRVSERVSRVGFQDCLNDFSFCVPFVTQDPPLDSLPNSADNTGIGDLDARVKWNFLQLMDVMGGRFGVAASLNVKMPTGDSGDQRRFEQGRIIVGPSALVTDSTFELGDPPTGTGIFRVKPQLIASGSWYGFEPHVNVGFELGETTGVTNDFIYAVGLAYSPNPAITFVGGVIGRYALDTSRPKVQGTIGPEGVQQRIDDIRNGVPSRAPETADAHIANATIGMKANLFDTVVVVLNFLFPANGGNLRDDLTPTIGVEWTF